MAEMVVAIAIFAILAILVAQSLVWSMRERARRTAHHAALEIAQNVLEQARAMPYEHLNQEWADGQMIPSASAALLPDGKVKVLVETDKLAAGTKRINVEVTWQFEPEMPLQSVTLMTVLSRREGGKR